MRTERNSVIPRLRLPAARGEPLSTAMAMLQTAPPPPLLFAGAAKATAKPALHGLLDAGSSGELCALLATEPSVVDDRWLGKTALHLVSGLGRAKTLRVLLDHGADINGYR